ncbi:MAG: hypothetical protein ACTHMM_21260 [Agriterribacter sp.]
MEYQDFSQLNTYPIEKELAKQMMLKNHYSHKWNFAFGAFNVGIMNNEGRLLGCAVFGNAMNHKSWPSITNTDPEGCIELNRLWIDDCLKSNTETWLLGRSFKLLREREFELVQSFADGRLGVGTTYQAANFSYHGFSKTQFQKHIQTGEVFHNVQFTNTANPRGMIWRNVMHAQGLLQTFDVRTYRYLYPLNKRAKKNIKLKQLPYPKERFGEQFVENYVPPFAQIARAAALANALKQYENRDILYDYLTTLTGESKEANRLIRNQMENKWVQKITA